MDDEVLAAMARWPNVPAVYGWLSLDARGRWRLHPQGDAVAGHAGEDISNPRILDFMNRNYSHDEAGRWFFQNGPQRVFVRLDAAPYILRVASEGSGLVTHTGRPIHCIEGWALDTAGRLYAKTEHGAGLIEDRDLSTVFDQLCTAEGASLLESAPTWLQEILDSPGRRVPTTAPNPALSVRYPPISDQPAALALLGQDVGSTLGFIANPSTDQA